MRTAETLGRTMPVASGADQGPQAREQEAVRSLVVLLRPERHHGIFRQRVEVASMRAQSMRQGKRHFRIICVPARYLTMNRAAVGHLLVDHRKRRLKLNNMKDTREQTQRMSDMPGWKLWPAPSMFLKAARGPCSYQLSTCRKARTEDLIVG